MFIQQYFPHYCQKISTHQNIIILTFQFNYMYMNLYFFYLEKIGGDVDAS